MVTAGLDFGIFFTFYPCSDFASRLPCWAPFGSENPSTNSERSTQYHAVGMNETEDTTNRVRLGLEFAGNWQRGMLDFGKFLVVGICRLAKSIHFCFGLALPSSILVIKPVVDGIAPFRVNENLLSGISAPRDVVV